MKKKLHIYFILLFFLLPIISLATHIVGGSLTYVYNGGSNYTITLKLYRDCGPGTAGFPGSVTISILGENGQAFNPSKNVTMNLGTVTNVPSSLDPCAVLPNPIPCVQEGIYTTTVNNLPPIAGGYHLYYQIVARNFSLLNVVNPGGTGESFYTIIPGNTYTTIWNEDFTLPNNTSTDNGVTSWSLTPGATAPSSLSVINNQMEIKGANNASAVWTSQQINISNCNSISLGVNLSESGTLDANDSIKVFYSLNNGPLIPFQTNGSIADDFTSAFAYANNLSGSTVKIVIRTKFDGSSPNSETYNFDNVKIKCYSNTFIPNSDPVFNLFPPLFICVNQPFTFNHSATDADGDSLVYSLYQPYNGENNAGPLDPTFPDNTAVFTPVNYTAGYTTLNPLGASPFSLNSSTGLLSGTPGSLGQFVVGVMVKEYRNGVYIGQTLRDFQFNVLNCPQPPPALAVPNATINNGCVAKITAAGISSVSATWTSISPGAPGTYNNYLACTSGCLNNTVTAVGNPPAYVDFLVCGISTSCAGSNICDTFRVTFNPTLAVNIIPINPTICFGQTSTTLTANGSGGTPPYVYLWNNVNPSQSINVGVGTYNVQLSDASGCPPVFNSVAVTAFSVAISANAGPNQTKCKQSPIANLNGTITGASGGIWSGGNGSFLPNNTTLSNVSYSPTPTEIANGSVELYLTSTGNGTCPLKTDTVKITYVNFTSTVTPVITNVSCFGSNNGSATLNLTGGFSPFTYLWNTAPSQTTSTANNLQIGTYSVTIGDAVGCTYQTTVNITQPPVLSINSIFTNLKCFGIPTGSISATPVGGTSPYSYSWTPGGQTSSSLTALSAGNYSVIVTDSKGCIKTASYTITQPTALAVTVTQTNVTCFGLSNGKAIANTNGGTSPYSYNWMPSSATSQTITGLNIGTYSFTATDNLNCKTTQTIAITQPSVLVATTTKTNETCNYLNNGAISVTQTGGTAGYTYAWLPGSQTTTLITNQPSGSYTVTVTDNKGCTTKAFATITEPSTLNTSFINQINVSCFSGSNASVGVSPSGGTPAYTYTWLPSGNTSSTLNNIPIGTYTLIVNDSKLCATTNTITITQPTNLVIANTATNVSCNGGNNGRINLTPSGGTSPYTYFWSIGGQTTSSVSNLTAGIYSVTVKDFNGCSKTATYTITQPSTITIATTQTNASCYNLNNGSINSSVTGGTSPYTYNWLPTAATTANVTGLIARIYTLTVTDNLNCKQSQTIAISQPSLLIATTTKTNETCSYSNNGSASVSQTGGTSGYTYLWQPGGLTTSTITNQASGTYTATVTDSKGCTAKATAIITEPAIINIAFKNQVNVSCFGGNNASVGTNVTGGTPNYTYLWSPNNSTNSSLSNLTSGIYTITVKDSKLCLATNTVAITQPTAALSVAVSATSVSCNLGTDGAVNANGNGGTPNYTYKWMPGNVTTQNLSNIPYGIYTVTATDSKNCAKTNTILVNQPAPLIPVITTTNSTCSNTNGIGAVSVTGGLIPYSYQWLPTGGTNSITTGAIIAGTYSVIVTDLNNCSVVKSFNINDDGGPIASIFSKTDVSCNGGSDGTATAGVIGGQAPLSYSWSPSGGNGITATGLSTGIYIVTITDDNGCQSLATTSPIIDEPPAITEDFLTSNVSCFSGSNATATITANGGTPGYTYTWLPSLTTGSVVTGLTANNYSVEIKDAKNCIKTATFSISQPTAALSAIASSTATSCFNGNDGSIEIDALGGTSPYDYQWQVININGQTVTNLSANTYTVIVTDAQNCTNTTTVTINQPTEIILTTNSINSNCGGANGQASVSATGGTGSYTYTWEPTGNTTAINSSLIAGEYTVQVSDANNCITTTTQTVIDNPEPTISSITTTSISCNSGSNGTATANVLGGTGPFTYTWIPIGGNLQTATGLTTGIYTVNITSANGCLVSAISSVIDEPTQLFSEINTTKVNCFGGSDASATVLGGGGTPSYTYTWLPTATSGSVISSMSAGIYSVQIEDANNCILTSTYSISQPTAAISSIINTTSVSCFNGNNGTASVIVSGGTSPYNYNWDLMGITSASIGGLSTGIYSVSIIDFNNCSASNTVIISQPLSPISLTANSIATSCNGGSDGTATVTPIGGTAGYTYTWTPFGGNSQNSTGLTPGSYDIIVKDLNACEETISINVSSPTAVTGSLSIINAACGLANGSVFAEISGGIGPYTYSWNPTSTNTSSIGGLLPGTYSLEVKDSFNCIKTLTTSLINIPNPVLSIVSTVNDSCFGGNNGEASISITQGTAPYLTTWLPFGGNTITATQLTAGVYTANVTDDRGCLSSITATILEPAPINITIDTIINVSCFGGNNGSITVIANGGTPGYSYSWSTLTSGQTSNNLSSGIYTVNVMDTHFCNSAISINVTEPLTAVTSTINSVNHPVCFNSTGSASISVNGGTAPYTYSWTTNPVQTNGTAINLTGGNYTAYVYDANGCVSSNTTSLIQPTQIKTISGVNDTICLNQSGLITANATGGNGNYFYVWQPVNVTNSGSLTISPTVNTTYTVVAFDQNGCAGLPDTMKAIIFSLTKANLQSYGLSPICLGQSSMISTQATGNTGPLTYNWTNGLGNGTGPYLITPTQPSTYIVTVSNNCGDVVNDTVKILFNPPPTIAASYQGTLTCLPDFVNFIDNSITGNSNDPITSWLWNFGDGQTSIEQNPQHIYTSPGTYSISLTVTTDGGCTNNNSSTPITVTGYPYPTAAFSVNLTQLSLPYDILVCTNQSSAAVSYNWDFGDGNTSTLANPKNNYTTVGEYQVQLVATSLLGCKDTAYAYIITDADVVFPNAFTPNTNGSSGGYYNQTSYDNDIFFPYTSGVTEYKLEIFNRWGELIFETEDIKQGWDGYYRNQICQVDVYVWKAYVKLNNGKVFNKTGDVTLLK